jgi:hypothetical protein
VPARRREQCAFARADDVDDVTLAAQDPGDSGCEQGVVFGNQDAHGAMILLRGARIGWRRDRFA